MKKQFLKCGFWGKAIALSLSLITAVSALPADNVLAAASSSTSSGTTRMSVHDPSIYYDEGQDAYHIFGSHMAQATSKDLRNWSGIGTQ